MRPAWINQQMVDKYSKQGFWSHDEDFIDSNAILYPRKEALVDYKARLTFSELKQMVDRLAVSFLNMGFKKDQVILLQLPNIVEHIIVHEALRKAGIISISPRMDMRHKEIEYALSKSEAVAVVIVKEYRNFNFYQMIKDLHQGLPGLRDIFVVGDDVPSGCFSINEIIRKPIKGKYSLADLEEVRIKPVDVQSISITSGTTGFPKLSEAMAGVSWIKGVTGVERWKVTGDDIFLALSPISGGGALPCIIAAPRTASKIVLFEISGKFDSDEAFKVIEKEKVTFACGVPAQMTMMIKNQNINKYDLSSLRVFYYAGASLPYSIAKEIEDTMGCRVLTLLGALDIGITSITSYDDSTEVRLTSVGKPFPGVEVKLLDDDGKEVRAGDVGEIVLRGPANVHSYFKDPEASLALNGGDLEKWSHMGDLGRFDADGNLYIVGRKKDIIIRGGQNIYPAEIEGMLVTHPSILNVAIVAMPDLVMGEKACAYVILKPSQTLSFNEMTAYLLDKKIAKHKLPERLEIVESFPMSGDGQKVLKRELIADIVNKLEKEASYTI